MKTTEEQDKAIAEKYNGGDYPFSAWELDRDTNLTDLQKWVDDNNLVGLVDESQSGIIGYVSRAHAERIASLLNLTTL